MFSFVKHLVLRMKRDESGLALTEYLVLLGLLVGGVLAAVITVGDNLEAGWTGWGGWFESNICVDPDTGDVEDCVPVAE